MDITFSRKSMKCLPFLREFVPFLWHPKEPAPVDTKQKRERQADHLFSETNFFWRTLPFWEKNIVHYNLLFFFFKIKVLIYSVVQRNIGFACFSNKTTRLPFCSYMNDNALLIKFARARNMRILKNNWNYT